MPTIEQVLTAPPPALIPGEIDPEALFHEARRRERRRRLTWLVGSLLVASVIGLAVAAATGVILHRSHAPNSPRVANLPEGRVVPLELAGPLTVSANGSLYVVDEKRHDIVTRTPGGAFRVVAGDGKSGSAGDGGPATKAELSNVTDLAFAPNGDLYLADGGRIRVVDHEGTIHSIAGNGRPVREITNGTPARDAALKGYDLSLAFSPSGQLYIGTQLQLLRLMPNGTLETVRAVVRTGVVRGNLTDFGQLAFDKNGDIYVATGFRGWSLFEVAPNGIATYIGYARRSGGSISDLATTASGQVEAESGSSILNLSGDQINTRYTFGNVPGTNWFTLTYFAFAPNGALYADDIGTSGFQRYQQLLTVQAGHITQLWRHRVWN